jgi:penicillin-binding protein 1A
MRIFRSRVFRLLFGLAALFTLAIAGLALYIYQEIERELPDLEKLTDYRPALTSTVYDRQGRPIGEFFEERRRLVPVGKIPKLVVQAFVAGEDDTFFEHTGLDYTAILRAAWVNLRAGGKVKQGGSTITQQVAKSLLLSSERSVLRKLKDMVLARRIEQHFSKDEILYLYLNQIYLGHGAYGVEQAARTYFGKDVADLTPSEAALIAGLPKAPSDYSPYNNPEAADTRRRYVLERMLHEGYLDQQQYDTAVASPPRLTPPPERDDYAAAGYFTEEVRRLLFDRLGSTRVLRGGLTIETTLDLDLQHAAVSAVRAGVEALERRHGGYRGPLRQVRRGTETEALNEIARENGFARAVVAQGGFHLSPIKNYSGLVTAVDPNAGTAKVALAPGFEATLHVDDVGWALKKQAQGEVHEPKAIATVLHVGDVAKFAIKRAEAPPASPPAVGAPPAAPPPATAARPESAQEPPHLVLTQEPRVEGALVSRDVTSGEILALVGGYDFARSEFDRATQARRQPGSAFKPFVYGAALLDGFTPVSILMDTPVVMIDPGTGDLWKPENYTKKFLGALTAREALARSINNATIHLFMDVGVNRVIEFAHQLGIRSPLGHNPSLALGSTEVSLLELTAAYTTIAAQGQRTPPVFLTRVLDRDGQVLLENVSLGDISSEDDDESAPAHPAKDAADPTATQAMAPEQAFLLTSLLRATIEEPYGTGHKAAALGRPLAGKTGTTDDQKDAWFVGFSPEVATGVWVGHDEKEVLGDKETGAKAALPIWIDFMQVALSDKPLRDFPVPQGIVFARVSKTTGLLAEAGDPSSFFEPFAEGTEPSERRATAGPDAAQTEGYDLLRNDSF